MKICNSFEMDLQGIDDILELDSQGYIGILQDCGNRFTRNHGDLWDFGNGFAFMRIQVDSPGYTDSIIL